MRKLYLAAMLIVTLLLVITGCDTGTGGTSSGEKTARSFEWARKIANEVRDTEMPDGVLGGIAAVYIDGSGLIDPDSIEATWVFGFAPDGAGAEVAVLTVYVDADGETAHSTGGSSSFEPIPDYNNGKVVFWITTADAEVDEENLDYAHRMFVCTEQDGINVVTMYYVASNGSYVAGVYLNADTGEVLWQ